MELKTLLETQQWTNAGMDLTQLMISRSTRSTIDKNMKVVVANNYKALILNALFLCFFVFIYVFNPKIEFLIPTILIVSCFLFLIVGVWKGITSLNKIDYSQSLVMLLSTFLNTNKEVFRLQRQYHAMVLVQSFLGGFLLGLAFQGWTVEKALSKPAIFAIIVPLTIGFYYLTKTKSFKSLHRALSPNYYKAKSYLQDQLNLLQEE